MKDLIEENGKLIGYLSGYSAFLQYRLNNQQPNEFWIATGKERRSMVRGKYRIRFVKQDNAITQEDIPLFQLLDCLRFFKEIPDTTPNDACCRLLMYFRN